MVGAKYQSIVGNVNQIFFALGTGVVSGNFNCFSVTKLIDDVPSIYVVHHSLQYKKEILYIHQFIQSSYKYFYIVVNDVLHI